MIGSSVRRSALVAGALLALTTSGCDDSAKNATPIIVQTTAPTSGPTTTPSSTPTTAPSATPTTSGTTTPQPAAIVLAPNALNFTTANSSQNFIASETAYAGILTISGTACAAIATVSPATASGPAATFTVTSVAAGSCSLTVNDANGTTASESVVVTTTSGTINIRH